MVSQIRFGITWHKLGIWLVCKQVGLRSEIFHPGSLFWKAKLSSLCQVIHKLIWLIKRVVISERDTCSLSQLFSVIVVAALFLCTLFHPPLLRVTVKSERIDATDSLLDWYLFIYLLIFFVMYPFSFCFLPFSWFCMSVFMFPAAVAAVLCCNTEAEVSLAMKKHTVSSTAALQAQGCLFRCFGLKPSLPSYLSVWTFLGAVVQYVITPFTEFMSHIHVLLLGTKGHYHFLSLWVIAHRCFRVEKARLFFLPGLKLFSVSVSLYFFTL